MTGGQRDVYRATAASGRTAMLRSRSRRHAAWRPFHARVLATLFLSLTVACGSTPPVPTVPPAEVRERELRGAIAQKDLAKADAVLGAMVTEEGYTQQVRDAQDELAIARAEAMTGDHKLAALDQVVARGGAYSSEAAKKARVERLARIAALIEARNGSQALELLDGWFGDAAKTDAALAEVRARAYDVVGAGCSDLRCRYDAAKSAVAAAPTPERSARLGEIRGSVTAALTFSEAPPETVLARAQRLRAFLAAVDSTADALPNDREVQAEAIKARTWARSERAKVAVLGADRALADELIGPFSDQGASVAMASRSGVGVYLALDARKRCKGVYLTGATAGARTLPPGEPTDGLLSQIVGHPAVVRFPGSASTTTSRWTEGQTPVVARWRDSALVELRIGDASP
jgi:hypothetical protein